MKEKKQVDRVTQKVETALPYHQFSQDVLNVFVRYKLNASTICVYHYLCLNQDYNRGRTHNLAIEDVAKALYISPAMVYRAIARLKEVGLFNPTHRGSIGGTLPYQQLVKQTAAHAKHEKQKSADFIKISKIASTKK